MREDVLRFTIVAGLLFCGPQVGFRSGVGLGLVSAAWLLHEDPAGMGLATLRSNEILVMAAVCAAAGW